MTLPPMPPLPEKDFMGLRLTEDSYKYTAQEIRTYAEQYGRLCAEAERAELEAVIDMAARVMHGEGVSDQGEAWDQCLRILDTARKAKP